MTTTRKNVSTIITPLFPLITFLIIYRLLNALLLQTQFDPDEYWQTLEPSYCLVFSDSKNCAYTWEWTRRGDDNSSNAIERALHGPVRSYLSILPTYFFYLVARTCRIDTTWMISRGPVLWNACIVAVPTDVCVYWIASRYIRRNDVFHSKSNAAAVSLSTGRWMWMKRMVETVQFWALMSSLTSWFHGYALVRTYSNSMETMLFLLGITLLGPELFDPVNGVETSNSNAESTASNVHRKRLQHHLDDRHVTIRPIAALAFTLGGMSAAIRFTALAAWVPMGIIVCLRRPTWREGLFYLFRLCAVYGAFGLLVVSSLVDWWFYGFWTYPFLNSFHFNVWLSHGSLYGTHSFLWYFYAGFPAISGVMLPFFLYECSLFLQKVSSHFISQFFGKDQRKTEKYTLEQSPRLLDDSNTVLTIIILSYVSMQSLSAHKEFRFILPILPLTCILAGSAMQSFVTCTMSTKVSNSTKIASNIPPVQNDNHEAKPFAEKNVSRMLPPPPPSSLLSCKRNRILILTFAMILLNFPHFLFLGIIHQRASIDANKMIVSLIKQRAKQDSVSETEILPISSSLTSSVLQLNYSIHYLMGCHSTPLYSHLHIPKTTLHIAVSDDGNNEYDENKLQYRLVDRQINVVTDAWTLDCSPKCRSDPNTLCESDEFSSNPVQFVQKAYGISPSSSNSSSNICYEDFGVKRTIGETGGTDEYPCNGSTIPDFLLIFENDAKSKEMQDLIKNQMGLVEVAKFLHTLNGVEYHHGSHAGTINEEDVEMTSPKSNFFHEESGSDAGGKGDVDTRSDRRQVAIRAGSMGIIEITFDQMILFTKKL